MEPPEDTASLRTQISNLQAELNLLRNRYDTLLEVHNRAAEHYKADFKKWRDFKELLFGDVETDDDIKAFLKSGGLNAYRKGPMLRKRKHSEVFGPSVEHAEEDKETKGLKPRPESIQDINPDFVRSSESHVAVMARKEHRKSCHGESLGKILSSPPGSSKYPFLFPLSVDCGDKSPLLNDTGSSRPIPSTEPRKGRGRYAQVPSGIDTINSRFSIRKDRNGGLDFQYDTVVRNREERKRMLGGDCECCREYYDAVGPLPASRQPLWRTPTKRKSPHSLHASDDDKENTDEGEKHKQLISRHRHHWHRPKTPPGYWDIGFPDTQEVLDINQRAAEMHKRKLVEVEVEARNNDSRYVERAPRTS